MTGVLNYTTSIAPEKTISEMQKLLASAGAAAVSVNYAGGTAVGLSFSLTTPLGPRHFALPVDVEAMQRLLVKQDHEGRLRSGSRATRTSREQAERTAWRVMKDWLAAQLALVETQMASLDQVMLPYLHVDGERTLYQAFKERDLLELEAAGS